MLMLQTPDVSDLPSVLYWLATVGAPYITGKIFSYIAENFQGWHKLHRIVKFIVPMLVSVGISIGATVLMSKTGIVSELSPTYSIIAGSIMAYLGTQNGYMDAKRSGYGASAKPSQG